MPAGLPDFRLGTKLATSFTATLTERRGDAVERIPTPQRLVDWLTVSGLAAADAIGIIAGERDGRLSLCAPPTSQAAFFDTGRSRTRRWCDMNTCGNREKKARFVSNRRRTTGSPQ